MFESLPGRAGEVGMKAWIISRKEVKQARMKA
jgi:hypothetical protein